jgi:iron complex transport system ATP-binding protein
MVAISKGKIVRHGTAMEVLTPSVLKTVFQIDAKIVIEENTQRPICLTYNLIKENANDSFI